MLEEEFSNETINTTQLPKFEEVQLTPLHPDYWKVIMLSLGVTFSILAAIIAVASYMVEEVTVVTYSVWLAYFVLFFMTVLFSRVGFKRKAFAFRTHDVLYQNGIIGIKTIVIPYNRVQHVALHEGVFARYFGLAEIQVFTAGGGTGDISIPGLRKTDAENIKALLMGKIQKDL